MVHAYLWNAITHEGVYLDLAAKTSITSLQALINNLESYRCTLIAINEQGVIISNERMRDKIEDLLSTIIDLNTHIENQSYKLDLLAVKYDTSPIAPITNLPPEKDESGEALYLMWDLIPEELRKKLIIYIKKL